MASVFKTIEALQGDTVDVIARREYGTERRGNAAAILEANPSLAAFGPVLPMGTRVRLPRIDQREPDVAVVSLWADAP